jgi:hypothetical protein
MTNIETVTKFKFASLGIVMLSYTVALAYYIYIGWRIRQRPQRSLILLWLLLALTVAT